MRVITSHEKAAVAADKWFDQYYNGGNWHGLNGSTTKTTYQKLRDLGKNPDPDKVNEVIGNTSWTTVDCETCGMRCTRWLAVHTEAYKTFNICEKCLSAAHMQMFPNGE